MTTPKVEIPTLNWLHEKYNFFANIYRFVINIFVRFNNFLLTFNKIIFKSRNINSILIFKKLIKVFMFIFKLYLTINEKVLIFYVKK